jgi:glycerophosphoryl diester phosphodiesterase
MPPLLSSFSTDALAAALAEAPELPRALLCTDVPEDWQQSLDRLQCAAMHVAFDRLNSELVTAIQATRRGVLAYTVNDSIAATELLAMGVDALVTDQLDVIGPHFAS